MSRVTILVALTRPDDVDDDVAEDVTWVGCTLLVFFFGGMFRLQKDGKLN